MKRVPFARAPQELRSIFGELAEDPSVVTALERVDAGLREFAAALDWRTEGLTVEEYPGPPCRHRLAGYVESSELTFWIELSAGDFYADQERPGRYCAEAEVLLESTSFTGQETAATFPSSKPTVSERRSRDWLTSSRSCAGERRSDRPPPERGGSTRPSGRSSCVSGPRAACGGNPDRMRRSR